MKLLLGHGLPDVLPIWKYSKQIIPRNMNHLSLRLSRVLAPYHCQPFSSTRIIQSAPLRLRSSPFLCLRTHNVRHEHFSSSALRSIQQETKPEKSLPNTDRSPQNGKRKTTRTKGAKNSLRRVAVEAQRSKDGKGLKKTPASANQEIYKVGLSLDLFANCH